MRTLIRACPRGMCDLKVWSYDVGNDPEVLTSVMNLHFNTPLQLRACYNVSKLTCKIISLPERHEGDES